MPELNLAFDLIRNERSTVPFGNRLRIDGRNAVRIPTIRWFEVRNRSNARSDSIGFDRIVSRTRHAVSWKFQVLPRNTRYTESFLNALFIRICAINRTNRTSKANFSSSIWMAFILARDRSLFERNFLPTNFASKVKENPKRVLSKKVNVRT